MGISNVEALAVENVTIGSRPGWSGAIYIDECVNSMLEGCNFKGVKVQVVSNIITMTGCTFNQRNLGPT